MSAGDLRGHPGDAATALTFCWWRDGRDEPREEAGVGAGGPGRAGLLDRDENFGFYFQQDGKYLESLSNMS